MSWLRSGLLSVVLLAPASAATAGAYGDELRDCFLRALSSSDRETLGVAAFVAMAQDPRVQGYVTLTPSQADAAARRQAGVIERLLVTDCRTQTVAALKNEGLSGISAGVQALGRLSVNELTNQPIVVSATNKGLAYVDRAKLAALAKEAGLPEAAAR